jgi:aspartyl protease family protein
MAVFVAAGLAVGFALMFLVPRGAMIANMEAGEFIANAAYVLLALVLAASLIHRYRGRFGAAARDAAIWIALAIGFVGIYAYRDAITPVYERIMAEVSPGYVVTPAPGVAEVARRNDGHYILKMKVNGVDLPFLFDTGASVVVLRAEDAQRIGIDTSKLAYTEVVSTANGVTRAAETRLDTLSVGSITQTRVRALVARDGALRENLLGQSFLNGLGGYGVENGRLVLRGK